MFYSLVLLELRLLPCIYKMSVSPGPPNMKQVSLPRIEKQILEIAPDMVAASLTFGLLSLFQEKLSGARTSNTTTPQPPSPGTSPSTSRRPSARMSGMLFVSTPESLSLAVTFGGHGGWMPISSSVWTDRWTSIRDLWTVSEHGGSS